MDKEPITQHVREMLESHSLNEHQLRKLHEIHGTHASEAGGVKARKFNVHKSLYFAAAFMFFIVFSSLLFLKPVNTIEEITHEVAYNHLHLKPLEVRSSDIGVISKQLKELKFQPFKSNYFSALNGTLLGGRYCSIQRSLAVQLRYETNDGKSSTLYQTAYNASKFSSLPNVDRGDDVAEYFSQGMLVRIWIEKGLVLASVSE